MNSKQVKYYEILSEFFSSDILKQAAVDKYFGEMLKHDFGAAEDLWEFMLIRNDSSLGNPAIAALYIDRLFALFKATNEARTLKLIADRPVIMRAIFQFSSLAGKGDFFSMAINLLIAGKTDTVDAIFKLVAKNEATDTSFGGYMINFLDRFFIEMMKKDAQRRVKLNTKQSSLLLSTVQKVKGDERAMLIQRVKEVM